MKKFIIITFIFLFLIFSYNSVEAEANENKDFFDISPIYPINENVIGLNFDYDFAKMQVYSSGVYAFSADKVYYDLGGKYFLKDNLIFDLKYNYWLEANLPNYNEKRGYNLGFSYKKGLEESLNISLFSGEIAKLANDKGIKTDYINLNYNKELYYDWENQILVNLDINSGQIRSTGDSFYSVKMNLPYKRGSFLIEPAFAYLNDGKGLNLSYNLKNVVKGYSMSESGNKYFNIKVEKRFATLRKTSIPVLELFDIVPFLNTGEVWDENVENLNLKYSTGLGLSLDFGGVDFRLDAVVDDRGEESFLFSVDKSI